MSLLKPALFSLLLFLPACELIGPIAGAAGGIYGQALLSRSNENVEARLRWRMQKTDFIQEITSGILSQAREERQEGNYLSWRLKMDELIEFHETQRPDLLIVKAAKRLKQLEREETDQVQKWKGTL